MSESSGELRDQSIAGMAFVLDDEPQIGALICQVLKMCGLTPRQFTCAAPFVAALDACAPEIILLDLSLGQSDAVEIIRHLEVRKYRGKVLLISGRDAATLNEIRLIGEKHGLAMLRPMQKPFRPADLKQRLASHAADVSPPQASASDADDGASAEARVQIVEALRRNWLDLWYQPKIDLRSLSCCGAEGLVRALHPVYGVVTPERLLPPPGDPDYQPLTKFVIERAMTDWNRFARQGLRLKLSINAPVSVIHNPAFVTLVRSVLPSDSGFPGMTIEVTEDEVVRDSEWAHEVAAQLKLYNVGLSIDDFGKGYASLSRLTDLPFIEVKIDRSFVAGCALNPLKRDLCQTVVDLAHRLGAPVCAEGVENIDDLQALTAMQCDTAQGFLFAKPMPADKLASLLLCGSADSMRSRLYAAHREDRRTAQTG